MITKIKKMKECDYGFIFFKIFEILHGLFILIELLTIFFKRLIYDHKYKSEIFDFKKNIINQTIINNAYDYPISKIINNNNNTYIIDYPFNYEYLLHYSTKDKCLEGFKKCGILDTMGNTMCIEEKYPCPINEIIIDDISKNETYYKNNFSSTILYRLPKNKLLYYTNESIDKEIIVKIKDEVPNYISDKDIFFIEDNIENLLNKKESLKNEEAFNFRNSKKLILNITNDNKTYILENIFNKKDKYYKPIDDNLYIKNFIGFENCEQMKLIIKINYDIINRNYFPNLASFIFAIVITILILGQLILMLRCCEVGSGILLLFISIPAMLGYLIYFLYVFYKINPYKYILVIKTDDFIKDFMNELCSIIEDNNYILLILFALSSFLFFSSFLIIFSLFFYDSYKKRVNKSKNY